MLVEVSGFAGAFMGARVGAYWGGGTALVGGQLGPQAAVPEEIVTVPLGAIAGGIIGAGIGFWAGSESTKTIYEWTFEQGFEIR